MNGMKQSMVLKLVALLALILAGVQGASADDRTQRDPLAGLKRSLTEAGAAALTTDQETALTTLITNYQTARTITADATLTAAQTAFETAILAGDLATAQAQAAIIANRRAALELAALNAEATFKTSFLKTLTEAQLTALKTRFGTSGLLRLLGGGAAGGGGISTSRGRN